MLRDWTDSLKLEKIPATAERLFVRIIMKADDYGRFHADPRLVRAACFPLEDCGTKAVESDLQELAKRGLIYVYTVEERDYLAVVNYGQRLKQSRPKFPPEDGSDDEWKPTSGNFRELPARIRREGEGEENTKADKPPVVLPFESDTFKTAWQDWRDQRKAIKKPMTHKAEMLALKGLPTDEAEAIRWIENAIMRGWQGIFEPNGGYKEPSKPKRTEL